ncbi:MAG: metallophosphoesterase family protein, partial [Wenzhouxiangellaceae bacterium]
MYRTIVQFVHITDPHLTSLDGLRPGPLALKRWMSWLSWQRKRREVHRPERLATLISALRRHDPDAWAVTGDLCQIGLIAEIKQARAWLAALDKPERVLLVPGNHDIFARDSVVAVREQWRGWMASDDAGAHGPVVRRVGPISLIGVNSAVVTPPGFATGRVGASALDR